MDCPDYLKVKINPETFECLKPDILRRDYNFLLDLWDVITEDQYDSLKPHIVDKFITEMFEEAEWEGRFQLLEDAKEIYSKDMCFPESDFVKLKVADCQDIFISKSYHPTEEIDTLIIPVELFKSSNMAPLEIIVYTLKMNWNRSYSTIAKMLNRDPRTIETTFKRAIVKMERDKP